MSLANQLWEVLLPTVAVRAVLIAIPEAERRSAGMANTVLIDYTTAMLTAVRDLPETTPRYEMLYGWAIKAKQAIIGPDGEVRDDNEDWPALNDALEFVAQLTRAAITEITL